MHIADQDHGNLGANAIVGGQRRHRHRRRPDRQAAREQVGRRLLLRRRRARPGGSLRGHEHGRPVEAAGNLRLREQPAMASTRTIRRWRPAILTARAEAFGIEAFKVDGQNVLAVNKLAQDLVARARKRRGSLLRAPRYLSLPRSPCRRHRSQLLPQQGGRGGRGRKNRDPIVILGNWLTKEKVATATELDAIREEVKADAEAACQIRARRSLSAARRGHAACLCGLIASKGQ
jgi:acetoin:2,6-dichlorophenolindophenol oxidoreductase subunit alpha